MLPTMPGRFSELGEAGVDSGVESTLLAKICMMTLICVMFLCLGFLICQTTIITGRPHGWGS